MKISINLDKEYTYIKEVKENLERSIVEDKKAIEHFPSFAQEDPHNTFIKGLREDEEELARINKALVCSHRFESKGFHSNDEKVEIQTCINCGLSIQIQAALGWFSKDEGSK